MELPEPQAKPRWAPPGKPLMHHQAELIEAVAQGHRTFLLADEPGLGKTAQSLLAASVAGALGGSGRIRTDPSSSSSLAGSSRRPPSRLRRFCAPALSLPPLS